MKLTIGNSIESKPNPQDMYRITIDYMHGDADGYTSESFDFPSSPLNDELIIPLYELAHAALTKEFEDHTQWRKAAKKIAGKSQYQDMLIAHEDLFVSYLYSFAVTDMFSDNEYTASVQDVTITYFNNEGIEHEVTVK